MSPTEMLGGTIGNAGIVSLSVAPGGGAGEGAGRHQLEKFGRAGAGGVSIGVSCRGLRMADICDDSQWGRQGIQRKWASGGHVEVHHQYR